MFKYDEFILESQLDLIKEAFVFFSPPLKKILKRIDSDISRDILGLEIKDIKDDITFIDIDKEPGFISFTTTKNAKKNLSIRHPEISYAWLYKNLFETPVDDSVSNAGTLYDIGSDIWNKSRTPLRIGRLVNKLFPDKYSNKEVEDFTNKFKSILENSGQKIKVVEADEIAYWYKSQNYKSQDGNLGNSCMKSKGSNYFEIYSKNPEVCRMVCILEDDGEGDKLIARALVWKVDTIKGSVSTPNPENFEYFMDRQYAISDDLVEKLRNYANDQGWAFKTNNNHHSYSGVTYKSNKYSLSLVIQLNLEETYSTFPYMDTFRRYDPKSNKLFNDDEVEGNDGDYLLNDTGGGYEVIEEEEDSVYSEYYDCEIPVDHAVYSDYLEDYIWRSRSVEVSLGARIHRGYYPEDFDDIIYDEWREDHIHIDDSVYSEIYGYSFYKNDAISVVSEVDSDGNCNEELTYVHEDDDRYVSYDDLDGLSWFENLKVIHKNWKNHSGVLKKLLYEKPKGIWYLKKFEIKLNVVKSPIKTSRIIDDKKENFVMSYIDKLDAELLNIEILDETHTYDLPTYISDLIDANLFKKLENKIKDYINNQPSLPSDEFEEIRKEKIKILNKKLSNMEYFSNY